MVEFFPDHEHTPPPPRAIWSNMQNMSMPPSPALSTQRETNAKVSGESNKHLTQALAVLTPVLSAAAAARPEVELAPHVGPVCAALCGRGLLDVDPSADGELWEAELSACRAAVGTGLGDELRRPRVRLDVSDVARGVVMSLHSSSVVGRLTTQGAGEGGVVVRVARV